MWFPLKDLIYNKESLVINMLLQPPLSEDGFHLALLFVRLTFESKSHENTFHRKRW